MVDFHAHILPGIDDGSKNVDESLTMLAMEAEQGIGTVVATPHFYPRHDDPETFLTRREAALAALCGQLERRMPRIVPGAEVHFFRGMSESDIIQSLTVGNSPYILIEMPMPPWPEDFYRELESVYRKQGLTPIVAHIDRYIAPLRTRGIPEQLAQLPVLVQANAEFFCRSSLAMKLLKEDKIHLLGSDCHNTDRRKPNLAAAVRRIEQKLGQKELAKIHGFERMILADLSEPEKAGVSL